MSFELKHMTRASVLKNLKKDDMIEKRRCPECGGILVTSHGDGLGFTRCVDCLYNDFDYDI